MYSSGGGEGWDEGQCSALLARGDKSERGEGEAGGGKRREKGGMHGWQRSSVLAKGESNEGEGEDSGGAAQRHVSGRGED